LLLVLVLVTELSNEIRLLLFCTLSLRVKLDVAYRRFCFDEICTVPNIQLQNELRVKFFFDVKRIALTVVVTQSWKFAFYRNSNVESI